MTVEFNCPNCEALIAFDNQHSGKRGRCMTCGQLFIIPAKSFEKAEKVKSEPQIAEPQPGFYRAVFVDSWKLFANPKNVKALVFVTALVFFRFFLGRGFCCINYIFYFVTWGWLFGFYLNIIYQTAFDMDELPEIYLGTSITFLWYIIKPFLVFMFTLFIVQLPLLISFSLLNDKGITYQNMWQAQFGVRLMMQIFFIVGVFLFPIAILTTAVGRDYLMLLNPKYIFVPVFKAFIPYLITFAILTAACLLEINAPKFDFAQPAITVGHLMLNLLVQVLAIIAMRTIGLFYRHYSCYLQW